MTNTSLNIMLVDANPRRAEHVKSCLQRAGFASLHFVPAYDSLLRRIEQHAPDIIVIDLELPARDILESLSVVTAYNPTPIVMFTEENDPSFIAEAVRAGVSAYVVDGIRADTVKPIIDVAMAQFRAFQELRSQLAETQLALNDRVTIDRAKSLLMKLQQCSEQEAYSLMRRHAMNENVRLAQVAQGIIDSNARHGGST